MDDVKLLCLKEQEVQQWEIPGRQKEPFRECKGRIDGAERNDNKVSFRGTTAVRNGIKASVRGILNPLGKVREH